MVAESEDNNRVLIPIDRSEWEVDSVLQEFRGGNECCTVMDAKIGSDRSDLQSRPSKGHRTEMKRASPAFSFSLRIPRSTDGTNQTPDKIHQESSKTRLRIAAGLSRIAGWFEIGRRSLCGEGDGVLASQSIDVGTTVAGAPPSRSRHAESPHRAPQESGRGTSADTECQQPAPFASRKLDTVLGSIRVPSRVLCLRCLPARFFAV